MRYYYDKLIRIMQTRKINFDDLSRGAGINTFTCASIAAGYNISQDDILKIQKYLNIKVEDFLTWQKDEPEIKPRKQANCAVLQYTRQGGEFIARHDSARAAGLALKKDSSAIARCCNGTYKSAYGFVWRWEVDSAPEIKVDYSGFFRFCFLHSVTPRAIMQKAKIMQGVIDRINAGMCISRDDAGRICAAYEIDVPALIGGPWPVTELPWETEYDVYIRQMDPKTGVVYADFISPTLASRATGVSRPSIIQCCDGQRNTAGGYAWRRVKLLRARD